MMKQITHVIFDFDGTLVDSPAIFRDSLNHVLEPFGHHITWDEMRHVLRSHDPAENCRLIRQNYQLDTTDEQFSEQVMSLFFEMLKEVKLMAGAEKLIKWFHQNGIPMAICTASKSEEFKIKATAHGDLFKIGKYFDTIVFSGENPDISTDKPSPEPYLYTLRQFHPEPTPEHVLVFEDSTSGVTSAIQAGTTCVIVPHYGLGPAQFNSGGLLLSSLDEFNAEVLGLRVRAGRVS